MIKTHKPRGHFWTHASAFQQSKEYRNIAFDDCVVHPSKALVEDPDDRLPAQTRAKKRRRVERLAEDFLNGKPLFISSVRPSAATQKATIARDRGLPKSALATAEAETGLDHPALWEDQETDAEILARLQQFGRSDGDQVQPSDEAIIVQSEEARAGCSRTTRLRPSIYTLGPSEEALRKAASLRSRKFRRANSELPTIRDGLIAPAADFHEALEPRSEPSYDVGAYQDRRAPSPWLSRRDSHMPFAGQHVDGDSIDELQLSGVRSSALAGATALEFGNLDPHVSETRLSRGQSMASGGPQSHQLLFETAPEPSEAEIDSSAYAAGTSDKFYGSTVATVAPSVVNACMTESTLASIAQPSTSNDYNATSRDAATRLTRSAARRTMQHSADPIRSSAPGKIQHLDYLTAQASQNGSTPLKYRKGRLRSHEPVINNKDGDQAGQTVAAVNEPHPSDSPCSATKEAIERNLADSAYNAEQAESLRETWAGTQFLLHQAQRELVISPEKQLSAPKSSIGSSTPRNTCRPTSRSQEADEIRKPLHQLSQEPMPSTQAMLGNFEGWSTVKKPRGTLLSDSPYHTPTAKGKSAPFEHSAETCTPRPRVTKRIDKRASNLRFSMPANSSPDVSFPVDTATIQSFNRTEQTREINGRASAMKSSSVPPSISSNALLPTASAIAIEHSSVTRSGDSAALISSFQAGQGHSPPPRRDSSDLDDTVDDLTKDLLAMDDMSGVLSQIG